MPIIFAVLGTPLAHFAEGAILGATVYLVSRGKTESVEEQEVKSNLLGIKPVPRRK